MLKCRPGVDKRRRCCVCLTVLGLLYAAMADRATIRAYADTAAAPTGQFDLLRGDTGRTSVVSDNIAGPPALIWKVSIAAAKGNLSPVYSDGVVYVAMAYKICAVRISDGDTVWTLTGKAKFNSSPTIIGDYLYIGADDSNLYKISLADGSVKWQNKFDAQIRSAPVAANGTIYFGTESGNVYAVDADSGSTTWTYMAGGPVSTPLVVSDDDTQVFFAAGDGKVYGVDASSGRDQWSLSFPADPSIAPPVFSDDTLYVAAGRDLFALNPHRGGVRWRQHFDGDITVSPTVADGSEFVATDDMQLASLDDRGHRIWSISIPYFCNGGALLAGSMLVVPLDHGLVYAYDSATGGLRWSYLVRPASEDKDMHPSTVGINCPPVYADGTLFILTTDGTLSAFQPAALDQTPPVVYSMQPTPGETFDPKEVKYQAALFDEGCGVNSDSVTLSVDGKRIDGVGYDPLNNGLTVKSSVQTGDETLPDLDDGPHTVTLTAADWKGNTLKKTWGFYVKDPNPKAATGKNGSATATTTTVVTPNSSGQTPQSSPGQPAGGAQATQQSGGSGATIITGGSGSVSSNSGSSPTTSPHTSSGNGSSGGNGSSSSGGGSSGTSATAAGGGSAAGGGMPARPTRPTQPTQPTQPTRPTPPTITPTGGPPPPPI